MYCLSVTRYHDRSVQFTNRFMFLRYLVSASSCPCGPCTHFRGILFHFHTHQPTPGHFLAPAWLDPSSAASTTSTYPPSPSSPTHGSSFRNSVSNSSSLLIIGDIPLICARDTTNTGWGSGGGCCCSVGYKILDMSSPSVDLDFALDGPVGDDGASTPLDAGNKPARPDLRNTSLPPFETKRTVLVL